VDAVEVLAPAKVNLALHVTGRRADGYHLLDSLVVFADTGDRLAVRRATGCTLAVRGPFAAAAPAGEGNLALRAARLAGGGLHVDLHKFLPAGAGIGGGSSDAAAVLRAAAALNGGAPPDGLSLGADVPVCVAARPVRMRGVGERLDPTVLPPVSMVLVWPGAPVATADVFARRARTDGAPMPDHLPAFGAAAGLAAWLQAQRNDLEAAATDLTPEIGAARAALAARRGCLLARMSGSGSTVFGIFAHGDAASAAAAAIAAAHPGWWVRATRTLAAPPPVQERRLTT
jgi:4-diphosphocytidyl-2-C-methyl-D-erythritol kinase